MKFLKMPNKTDYWEIDLNKMKLYNYQGGWQKIDENSEEWLEGEVVEAEDWYDLYLKTGFIPFFTWNDRNHTGGQWDCWINPKGLLIFCDTHECTAEDICEIMYGLTYNHGYGIIRDAGDVLIDKGWRKGSRNFNELHYEYATSMTAPQAEMFQNYCKWLGIPYPAHRIYIVKGEEEL